jgi:hypothetical protein
MSTDTSGLSLLGRSQERLPQTPDEAQLETFANCRPGRHYWVTLEAPEFSTLCPVTGSRTPRGSRSATCPSSAAWKPSRSSLPRLVPQLPRIQRGDHQPHPRRPRRSPRPHRTGRPRRVRPARRHPPDLRGPNPGAGEGRVTSDDACPSSPACRHSAERDGRRAKNGRVTNDECRPLVARIAGHCAERDGRRAKKGRVTSDEWRGPALRSPACRP